MQQLQEGSFLKATALLDETIFEGTTIFLTEYNDKGTVGCIVNKAFGRSINELSEFLYVPEFPLYNGGPVATEYLFFIHQAPAIIPGGKLVKDGVYVSGSFKQAIEALCKKQVDENDLKIFVGYCGWDKDQLEGEIAEGSWKVVNDNAVFAFE
ncbi:YqgE/AlgH family protein [Polluticaenibacter yanchengensis]|uniref:YqgE/AlgH family protein n=1 Tax=Polluticaenibacter yanchengensis TaxID=3014562 RepID=A0ABT4UKF5_9BACT|nr:YqgE/AlgH family protein [Chitinophagaceae bacterium LY-5]